MYAYLHTAAAVVCWFSRSLFLCRPLDHARYSTYWREERAGCKFPRLPSLSPSTSLLPVDGRLVFHTDDGNAKKSTSSIVARTKKRKPMPYRESLNNNQLSSDKYAAIMMMWRIHNSLSFISCLYHFSLSSTRLYRVSTSKLPLESDSYRNLRRLSSARGCSVLHNILSLTLIENNSVSCFASVRALTH